MNRRKFIKNSSLATAGITILPFSIFGKNAPSNKITVAVMGLNGRGTYLAENFSKINNVEVAYLCDVEDAAIAKGLKAFANTGKKPLVEKDIRKLVTKKDFDALIIAAPDHWHAPAAILGVTHGKHVYVEKPCGHNPYEGELLVEAMKKYPGQLIQMGSQRRSFPTLIEAAQQVKDGAIGNVYFGKAWYVNNRKTIGIGKKVPVPSTLDFDLWQGPAPRKEYLDNIVHYNWHWRWNWGTAETCNNATHELDCCRWFMGLDFPTRVNAAGGRYAYKDDWETPDTLNVSVEFGPDKMISWEGRSCNKYNVEGASRGFIIYGDKGTLVNLGNDDYKIVDADNKLIKEVKASGGNTGANAVSASGDLDMYHFENFIQSIKGEAKLTAPVSEGHKSVLMCHLANIAYRTGKQLSCNPANGHILNDDAAMAYWRRQYEKGWEPVL